MANACFQIALGHAATKNVHGRLHVLELFDRGITRNKFDVFCWHGLSIVSHLPHLHVAHRDLDGFFRFLHLLHLNRVRKVSLCAHQLE